MTGAGVLSPIKVVDVEEEVSLELLGGAGPHAVPAHHAALLSPCSPLTQHTSVWISHYYP